MDAVTKGRRFPVKEERKKIYVADDDDNIRGIVKTFLSSDGYEVEDFPTGDLLLARFEESPCDLAILDVMMPGSDGFTVCKTLREKSTVPIIMLTARDAENDYAMGMGLGSDDYITKPFSAMALMLRVRALFRRVEFESRKYTPDEAQRQEVGNLTLDEDRRHILMGGQPLALTPTEYEVLKYLMERADQAVSREELLNAVWGYETAVETRATDDTVRRLRQKLEGGGVNIAAVWGYGFRLEEIR
ncbi:MAG: response regulator transcription factor [Clostridia bacterium]|nr:response regulator transcription factor [Clostridia bacterium]